MCAVRYSVSVCYCNARMDGQYYVSMCLSDGLVGCVCLSIAVSLHPPLLASAIQSCVFKPREMLSKRETSSEQITCFGFTLRSTASLAPNHSTSTSASAGTACRAARMAHRLLYPDNLRTRMSLGAHERRPHTRGSTHLPSERNGLQAEQPSPPTRSPKGVPLSTGRAGAGEWRLLVV